MSRFQATQPVDRSPTGTASANVSYVYESRQGDYHTTVLTVSGTLGAITGGANQALGLALYTIPQGTPFGYYGHMIDSAYMQIGITQSEGNINADTPDVGLGTVVAAGANALLSANASYENILTGQTATNCTGTLTTATAAQPFFSNVATTVYLNVADGWAAGGDAAATVGGSVILNWHYFVYENR